MKVYFKNLNGIRFFAAALVLIHHAFFFTSSFYPRGPFLETFMKNAGRLGVNIFFILSGFLISYFLLVEKDGTKDVSYRTFYLKRILRIWPLYFAIGLPITLLSPFVLHKMGMAGPVSVSELLTNLVWLLFFAVNIQFLFAPNRGMFEISWSVCVEEQFYLIWPILINKCRKRIDLLIYSMFAISLLTRLFTWYILPKIHPVSTDKIMLYNYVLVFDEFDLFTTGLLMALIYRQKERFAPVLKKLFHPFVQVCMLVAALLYLLSVIHFSDFFNILFFDHLVCSVLFGYVLLAAVLQNTVFNLENRLLVTLGKISYGIYMFHTSIAQLILMVFVRVVGHKESRLVYDVWYPLTCLIVVCVISYFSYTWFEIKFIRKAHREKDGSKPNPEGLVLATTV
jgi:peptidoglycan/LPS O-acetylase OafA/YrhL